MIPTSISHGIDTVLILYHHYLKHKVEVVKRYSKDLPAVLCYPNEINQVWINLIQNALQAMNYQGILILETSQKEHTIHVDITDSGCGIPSEILPKIFDPLFTTKPIGEGNGLGLDIVKRILEKHQGEITVASIPGQTTFTVILPLS